MANDVDLVLVREAANDLRDYILSNELYWKLKPVSGGEKLPQLTIGNLLLSQARLAAAGRTGTQHSEVREALQKIEEIRSNWLANWRNKAGREFGSRLNLWTQYLRELRADARQHERFYANEVRQRAILSLLMTSSQANVAAQEAEQLQALDQVLRGISRPGPFVWEPELAAGFPQETFWYLYVSFSS